MLLQVHSLLLLPKINDKSACRAAPNHQPVLGFPPIP